MAYREVTMLEIKEVLQLWFEGKAKKEIARLIGVDRNTVRRYIKTALKCGISPGMSLQSITDKQLEEILIQLKPLPSKQTKSPSWKCCENQHEFIKSHLENGVKLTKIHRLLRRQGIEIPYSTIYRFAIKKLDFGQKASTIPIVDCEPGEEIQLDTGWMTQLAEPDSSGKRRNFRAWIFTSVYSRHRFVYPCIKETTHTAIEACEAAWKFFGGVFRVIIPDNTKTIVQLADPLEPIINQTFREYAQSRGFHIDPARSRSPKDKARVERCVQTVREDCFRGERLLTIEDARRRACHWALEEYGMRRHKSTQRLPLESFKAEEKSRLLPAPTESYDVPIYCDARVGCDQHARVATALYSLPFEFRDKTLRARADSVTVRFYSNGRIVKTHPRAAPGGRSTDFNDFPKEKATYASRDSTFLLHQAAEKGQYVALFAKALLDSPLPWTSMRRGFALLGLCRRFGDTLVNETCKIALAAEMYDISRLERMLNIQQKLDEPKSSAKNVIPIARYLRPASQYAILPGTPEQNTTDVSKNTGENRDY